MKKISYILYILLVSLFLSSCKETKEPKFYIYETVIEIRYSDNAIDTIFNSVKLNSSEELNFTIEVEKQVPCLILKVNWTLAYGEEILACDIKTFRILKQIRRPSI